MAEGRHLIQLRYGIKAHIGTPAENEPVYITDENALYIGQGEGIEPKKITSEVDLSHIEEAIGLLADEVGTINISIGGLSTAIAETNTQVTTLDTQVTKLGTDVKNVERVASASETRVDEIYHEVSKIDSLETKTDRSNQAISRVINDVNGMAPRLDTTEASALESKGKIGEIEVKVTANEKSIRTKAEQEALDLVNTKVTALELNKSDQTDLDIVEFRVEQVEENKAEKWEIGTVNKRVDTLIIESGGSSDLEVIDARTSTATGVTSDTLGNRLDAIESVDVIVRNQDTPEDFIEPDIPIDAGLLDGKLPSEYVGKSEFVAHKEEYVQQRQQDQLKVAKVEKELNDYKGTIANVNVNQESKQKVTGYGVVSLPKNSANGQVSVSVKGETITNLFKNGDFRDGLEGIGVTSGTGEVGSNGILTAKPSGTNASMDVFSRNKAPHSKENVDKIYMCATIKTNKLVDVIHLMAQHTLNGVWVATSLWTISNFDSRDFKVISGITPTVVNIEHDSIYPSIRFITEDMVGFEVDVKNIMSINLTQTFGAGNEPTQEQCDKMFANYFDGTKSTISASRFKSVGKNLFDDIYEAGDIDPEGRNRLDATKLRPKNPPKVVSGQQYSISRSDGVIIDRVTFRDVYGEVLLANLTSASILTAPLGSDTVTWRLINGYTKVMLEKGTVATLYEPYTESTQYLTNVVELRSLPNGTKDEVRVSGGKAEWVKRVSGEVVLNGSESWEGLVDLGNTFRIYVPQLIKNAYGFNNFYCDKFAYVRGNNDDEEGIWLDASLNRLGLKIQKTKLTTQNLAGIKIWLQANPITLTYQLAKPIITPIQTSGNLISYPSGTIYVENVVADAGIYTIKFDIKELQLPIKSIDKLIKYDFTTGVQTVLDTSLSVINTDKKSFTHPNLTKNDMVFVYYFYDVEGTLGETTIEYLDSRHTIKDTTNDKFYKWDIKSTNGVPTVNLTEVL